MSATPVKPRRSSPYDDDPMVRLTGLSLDPPFPPHQHAASGQAAQGSTLVGATDATAATPTDGDSAASKPAAPAGTEAKSTVPPPIDTERPSSGLGGDQDEAGYDVDGGVSATPLSSHPDGAHFLTLRALVTTREAGVIIGKAGKNVAEIREMTGVKAGVSKVVQGVHERILTVSGTVDALSKAFMIVVKHLLENPVESPRQREPVQPDCATVRLLVAHQLMGSIIGKGGARIRDIQEASGAKITVSKEMLPQSTERVIEIYGLADSIQVAVYQISECILNDISRISGTVYFTPESRNGMRSPRADRFQGDYNDHHHSPRSAGGDGRRRRGSFGDGTPRRGNRAGSASNPTTPTTPSSVQLASADPLNGDQRVETLAVPLEMIGSIIGRGGAFINQIRKVSGARLRIDEQLEGANTRQVTVTGSDAAVKTAFEMIYGQMETEKNRRLGGGGAGAGGGVHEGQENGENLEY
ncbi:RNA binding protein, heterogenous nuclear RNP-K like protein [Geranomyces michiganensis]|nr:RNA binding protein, heterogenous nuclear RNP-K like protein [Geranomyces michiganensis]